MGCLYMSGCFHDCGFFGELFQDFRAAEILREVVDLDYLLAQRFLALPQRELLSADRRPRVGGAGLLRLAQLLVDRLARPPGGGTGFEDTRGVVAPRHVHAGGKAVARRAGLQGDLRALSIDLVERRAERHSHWE